jgi:putative peptidoglycan lipid II flippase
MHNGRIPTLINVFMVATKVAAVLICTTVWHSPHDVAIVLTTSTSASYVVGAVAGHLLLSSRLGSLGFRSVARTVVQIGLASLLGGAAALAVVVTSTAALGDGHLGSGTALVLGSLSGLAVLGLVAWRLRIPELANLAAQARGRR